MGMEVWVRESVASLGFSEDDSVNVEAQEWMTALEALERTKGRF